MSVIRNLLDSGAEWLLIKNIPFAFAAHKQPKGYTSNHCHLVCIHTHARIYIQQTYTNACTLWTHMYRNCHAKVRQQLNVSLSSNQGCSFHATKSLIILPFFSPSPVTEFPVKVHTKNRHAYIRKLFWQCSQRFVLSVVAQHEVAVANL